MYDLSITNIDSYMGALGTIGRIAYNITRLNLGYADASAVSAPLSLRCTAQRITELRIDIAGKA